MNALRFVDLFAGLGGFHVAMNRLGHECVFASELDEELRELYVKNFPTMTGRVHGDIKLCKDKVPAHDVLCAGFPCQPFSKSGAQLGILDETRGTLFREILDIAQRCKPRFIILENVGNFGRHDDGRTWRIVKASLERLGYDVEGSEHVTRGRYRDWRDRGAQSVSVLDTYFNFNDNETRGSGLISPHHFGFPHHRERFFIVASLDGLPMPAFPRRADESVTSLRSVIQNAENLTLRDISETKPTPQQTACIEHWDALIKALPSDYPPPTFPLWGDELRATYPYEDKSPWGSSPAELGKTFVPPYPKYSRKDAMLGQLPRYAQEQVNSFRHWKISFIRQNRKWWEGAAVYMPDGWAGKLKLFPPSLRKLEWNAKGEELDIWKYVLQFRPSGLRVKRYTSSPALVAMTETQIPFLGPERRFLSRTEGRRLQAFPDDHYLPNSRAQAFKALGNAVHAGVVQHIAENLLSGSSTRRSKVTSELPKVISV